jgi:hypothetical protein
VRRREFEFRLLPGKDEADFDVEPVWIKGECREDFAGMMFDDGVVAFA